MFKSLLVAVDINDADGTARCAAAAVNMARSEGAALHVLNVIPDSGMAIVGAMLEADHFEKMSQTAHSASPKFSITSRRLSGQRTGFLVSLDIKQ